MAYTPIYFIGDVEKQWKDFNRILLSLPADARIIQLGDLGLEKYNSTNDGFSGPRKPHFERPFEFIPGNHECWPLYRDIKEPTDVYHNVRYMPGGWVEEWGGRRIGFLGGAHSIDRDRRTPGFDWFEDENITVEACKLLSDRVAEHGPLDLLITHTPPRETLYRMLFRARMVPDPRDMSAALLQNVWEAIGKPTLVCGHMHFNGIFHDDIMGNDVYVLPMLGVQVL